MSEGIQAVLDLLRPDLQSFAGYSSARSSAVQGSVWLNANESAWPNPADANGSSRPTVGSTVGGGRSALDDVDRQPAAAGFLVLVLHVAAGVAHGLDDLVQRDLVLAVAAHGHA